MKLAEPVQQRISCESYAVTTLPYETQSNLDYATLV